MGGCWPVGYLQARSRRWNSGLSCNKYRAGIEPGLTDSKSSVLTTRPCCLPYSWVHFFSKWAVWVVTLDLKLKYMNLLYLQIFSMPHQVAVSCQTVWVDYGTSTLPSWKRSCYQVLKGGMESLLYSQTRARQMVQWMIQQKCTDQLKAWFPSPPNLPTGHGIIRGRPRVTCI